MLESEKKILLQAKEVYAGKKSREEEFCDICFKTCRSKADKRRHEEGVHKKNEDVWYKCLYCTRSFLSQL